MASVEGINQLRTTYEVDCNTVVCHAAKLENGHTVIALVTQDYSWRKQLTITTGEVFGYELKCGCDDGDGEQMSGLNANMKMNQVDLGVTNGEIAIQFVKAKTFGVMTDYGTMTLPSTVNGHLIVFFWPEDEPGDHWNHFVNILDQAQNVTSKIAGIADNVVKIGEDAAKFASLFSQKAAVA